MNPPALLIKPSKFMKPSLSSMLSAIGILLCAVADACGAEKEIALRLLACEVSKEPMKVIVVTKNSSSAEMEVPSASFSPPVAVSGRAVEIKAPGAGETFCTATLPEKGQSFALLLASKTPNGLAPVVVRLDDDAFQPGDFQFINRSGKTVVVKLGGTEVVIDADGISKARPTDPANNGYYLVTMSTRSEKGDKVIASTRWPLDDSKRGYILFLAKPSGRVTYRSVEEFVAKP